MVDEFMICIDRLIESAYFESVNERERLLSTENNLSRVNSIGVVPVKNSDGGGEGCSKNVVRECRICQEEDEEHQMEAPCACNGTLKFAHRKCIQRWCNKKGDITCEICNQVYLPNYTLPPARSKPEVMAIDIRCGCERDGDGDIGSMFLCVPVLFVSTELDIRMCYIKLTVHDDVKEMKMATTILPSYAKDLVFRLLIPAHVTISHAPWHKGKMDVGGPCKQAWEPHIDLQDPRFLALIAGERQFLQSEYDDYNVTSSGSLACFRTVAIIVSDQNAPHGKISR
ncbi:RING/FYVE/PHD zinc finger superfamily protein [Actinidia rufa]|uniref:RING/FYVE/PHD zinc finger superfamily protein n=1 Tax=Actinidia rufa TaxID=165716 RepID=A0A7J0DSD9_9ERIC|nr:RING/FYVE/PHD zinc finger superfamily protein [Actinidia rufa]